MKEEFDFKKTGKRMPYTVPDNFFAEMEENVWQEVSRQEPAASPKRKFTYIRMAIKSVAAVAAVVALFFLFNTGLSDDATGELSDVELAFANLSTEDQAYLLEVYQDDIFMDEQMDEETVIDE